MSYGDVHGHQEAELTLDIRYRTLLEPDRACCRAVHPGSLTGELGLHGRRLSSLASRQSCKASETLLCHDSQLLQQQLAKQDFATVQRMAQLKYYIFFRAVPSSCRRRALPPVGT